VKKSFLLIMLVLIGTVGGSTGVPQTTILTNDDNPAGNTATAFSQNITLHTGGSGLGRGDFSSTGSAISSNAHCVFVTDTGSNDIASFEAPKYGLVGRFSNSALNFSANGTGGSIALTPNASFLYATYSGSMNLAAWKVNSNCSLTFIQAYVPSIGADLFSPLAVTPNGRALIVSAPDFAGAEIFSINSDGTLTDINNVSWSGFAQCVSALCSPAGIDITADSKIAVFGNISSQPSALTASITSTGLNNPEYWGLSTPQGLQNNNVPWFSKAGAAGTGFLYFGMAGFGIAYPSGEVTANFTESPLSISVANATPIGAPGNFVGAVRSQGSTLYVALYPNTIDVFTVNTNGSLTPSQSIVDSHSNALLSISVYPNTR
jgi:hypothetical protein